MTRQRSHRGFTLLELMLVMVIACVAMAMVAPAVSQWARGGRLLDEATNFVSIARYARSQAVASGTTYRMTIDQTSATYQLTVQDGVQFVSLGTSWGRAYPLPQGFRIEVMNATSQNQNAPVDRRASAADAAAGAGDVIDFYPTGRTRQVRVRLTSDRGDSMDIESPSPAEGFVIVPTGGAR